jgi:hypothetical protein
MQIASERRGSYGNPLAFGCDTRFLESRKFSMAFTWALAGWNQRLFRFSRFFRIQDLSVLLGLELEVLVDHSIVLDR